MRKILVGWAIAALAVGAVAAGCGDDDEDTTSSAATASTPTAAETSAEGAAQTVTIKETEYALDPSEVEVKPGEVTFEAVNDGSIVHNLEIEGEGLEEVSDDLQPGDSGELTVDLAAGQTYELYCAIADHAEQGMEGEVTVEDS